MASRISQDRVGFQIVFQGNRYAEEATFSAIDLEGAQSNIEARTPKSSVLKKGELKWNIRRLDGVTLLGRDQIALKKAVAEKMELTARAVTEYSEGERSERVDREITIIDRPDFKGGTLYSIIIAFTSGGNLEAEFKEYKEESRPARREETEHPLGTDPFSMFNSLFDTSDNPSAEEILKHFRDAMGKK